MKSLDGLSIESMYHMDDKLHYIVQKDKTSGHVDFCSTNIGKQTCEPRSEYYRKMSFVSAATHSRECDHCWAVFYVANGQERQGLSGIDYDISINHTAAQAASNPTAISYYRTTSDGHEYVVFFDNIYTVQVIDFTSRVFMKEPLIVSKLQDYQLASTWLGCPPELCFDSRVDYAYHDEHNWLILGRGKYYWKTKSSNDVITPLSRSLAQIQDIFRYKGEEIIFLLGGKVLLSQKPTTLQTIAPQTSFTDVDAAFTLFSAGNASKFIITSAATPTPECAECVAMFYTKYGTEYQSLINGSVEPIALDKLQNGITQNPTAISYYRTTQKGDEYVVFFEYIFTVQVIHFKETFQAQHPLIVSKTEDYQLASMWHGCPAELCFDSRVDYAYHDEKNTLVLGRGKYFRKLWSPSNLSNSKPHGYVQDMFMYEGEEVIFSAGGKIYYKHRWASFKQLAPETNFTDVDAAFAHLTNENKLMFTITSGDKMESFRVANRTLPTNSFELLRSQTLGSYLPGLPSSGVDAASSVADYVYFFKNNFYFVHNTSLNSSNLSSPKLMQGSLFDCDDSYYQSSEPSRRLNISSLKQMLEYRSQFLEYFSATAGNTFSMTSYSATSRTLPKKPRHLFYPALVIFILSTIGLILAILAGIFSNKKSTSMEGDTSPAQSSGTLNSTL
ncbi:hypothetical protein HDE_09134 [Halotydeus destructor]|nr:hypothetical protein HDE_09134 [Halotydeus destructor]